MKSKIIISLIAFFLICNSFAQTNLNDYKYVIVPEQFSIFNEVNKYRLNELVKFLYNKYGFIAYLESEELPEDLVNNRCLALRANVYKETAFLKIKVSSDLRNCNGQVVFTTKNGETREKSFEKGYNLAIRDAFTSFENINYQYVPNENNQLVGNNVNTNPTTEDNREVKRLQDQVKALQEEKERQQKALEEARTSKEKEQQKALQEKAEKAKQEIIAKENKVSIKNTVLYAQPIEGGYQLVDSTPKVVMILLQTGRKDTFIVKGESATVYKEDGVWYLSKTENNKVTTEKINIKF